MNSDRSKCWCWRMLVLGAEALKGTEETKELPGALMTCQYYILSLIVLIFINVYELYNYEYS